MTSPLSDWLCSHENESRSERRFGSRSKTWLGSWFELRAFTCIANAFPITIRICTLRGNILFPLHSPRWLTHAWLQHAFQKCTCTNHVLKHPFFHISKRVSKRFKSLIWNSFAFTKAKIRLSNQAFKGRITFRNVFRNMIRSHVNRPIVQVFWFSLFLHMGE